MAINWKEAQEKDNLATLIKESIEKKWTYKFPMPDWYKKAEALANMAIMKNTIIWIIKDEKHLLYVPFASRQNLLYAVHGDLLTGHDEVQKCRERLQNCYFWLNMEDNILKHIKECFKCQSTKSQKFLKVTTNASMHSSQSTHSYGSFWTV